MTEDAQLNGAAGRHVPAFAPSDEYTGTERAICQRCGAFEHPGWLDEECSGAFRSDGHRWYTCTHNGCSLGSGHTGPHRSASEERRLRLEAQKPPGASERGLREADEAASVAHDFIHGLNGVTAEEASRAIWMIHEALRPRLGSPSHPPEQKPNAGNAMRVLGSTMYLDSPKLTHGVKVNARQSDGWLTVKVEADESVIGWALSYNGRDIPIIVEANRAE